MCRALAACLFILTSASSSPLLAAPDTPGTSAPAAACEPGCGAPSLVQPIDYSTEIARGGEFRAEVTVRQPCSCVRRLSLNLAFTPLGSSTSRERSVKLDVAPGRTTSHVVLSSAELAKAKVAPGQYTMSVALSDDRDTPLGESVSGLRFKLGKTQEGLKAKPVVPATIGRDSELAVPFVFENRGDIPARVTALLVFTRPDTTAGIEYYTQQLVVPPGGAKHVVRLNAAKRRGLVIGAGPWLVTTAAFDASENRLAFFPGHLMMIGKTLSQPAAPQASTPVEQTQNLDLALTFKNDGDSEDLVTAVMTFSGPGAAKPIEYKVEGLQLSIGISTHRVVLTSLDRYNLGLKPGRWRVSTTALDRAGKRIETQRGNDIEIIATGAGIAAK